MSELLMTTMGGAQPCGCDKREKIRVEVARKPSDVSDLELHVSVKEMLVDMGFREQAVLVPTTDLLKAHVMSIRLEKVRQKTCHVCRPTMRTKEYRPPSGFDLANSVIDIVIYKLASGWLLEEEDEESGISMATITLPSKLFDGLWEDLIYDTPVKEELISYTQGLLTLAEAGVRSTVTGINRLLLFHGEPGTGKSSICKALAQKLSIILCGQRAFSCGKFVEINANSLFSKYFSESSKHVQKLFTEVFVLIDEIESLAMSRSGSSNGSDPGDAARVVNVLLTQIDSLRAHKNVLILTTSNLTDKIDPAFRDRADMEVYIGYPSAMARYAMLHAYLQELLRTGIVIGEMPLPPPALQKTLSEVGGAAMLTGPTARLWRMATGQAGMSGRGLKKIVALAYALFLTPDRYTDMETFLSALEATANHAREQRGDPAMSTDRPADTAPTCPSDLATQAPPTLPATLPAPLCYPSEYSQADGDVKMSIDEPTTVGHPFALCG